MNSFCLTDFRPVRLVTSFAGLLAFVIFSSLITISEVEAQQACAGSGAFPALTGFELVSCEFYTPGQSQTVDLTIPAVQTNDLLMLMVTIDDANTNSTFTNTIPIPAPYWTSVGAIEQGVIDSQVFKRFVLDGAAETGLTTTFDFPPNNERFFATVLQFRGALDFTGTEANGGVTKNTGTGDPAPAPALNLIGNADIPEVDNSVILRFLAADRNRITLDDAGTDMTNAGYTTLTLRNVGNGGGSVSGGVTALRQTTVANVPETNFDLTASEQYHTRTLSVQPYVEFRFVTESGNTGTSSECGVENITIQATSRDGTLLDWYTGTVVITASNSTSATWTNINALSGFTDNGNGSFTVDFIGGNGGQVTAQYFNPVGGNATIDFAAKDSTGTYSENSAFADDILTMLDCEWAIAFEAGNTVASCGAEQLTITLQDTAGTPAQQYDGTLTINNNSASLFGNYSSTTPGFTFLDAIADDGQATVVFDVNPGVSPNNQVVVDYTHGSNDLTSITFLLTENSTTPALNILASGSNPSLGVDTCEIRISYPGTTIGNDLQGATCARNLVQIDIVDSSGTNIDDYTGTIQITNPGVNLGSWSQSTVTGALDPNSGGGSNNGQADYTFVDADDGSKVLEFELSTQISDIDFNIVETSSPITLASPTGIYDADIDLLDCTIVVSLPDADTTRDVCTFTRVQYEIQSNGAVVNNFAGTLNLSTSAGQGSWFENSAETYAGAGLQNGGIGDGTASYVFDGSEGGNIIFDFRNPVTATGLGFSATGTASNGANIASSGPAPTIDIAQCTLTITTASVTNQADVCAAAESVTYTLTGVDGPANGYDGTVVLNTSTGTGNYVLTTGSGDLQSGLGNDGFATYEFAPTDNGVFEVDFGISSAIVAPTDITLQATLSNVTVVNTDGTLTFNPCRILISYEGDTAPYQTDTCSIKQVRLTVESYGGGTPGAGSTVGSYTGTVNLSTSTGFGTWSADGTANGTLLDSFGEDGLAQYQFDASDNGTVLLNFTQTADDAVALNINATDSITSDVGSPGSTFDPNLSIDPCVFRITLEESGSPNTFSATDQNMTACEVQRVRIEVFHSLAVSGGSLPLDPATDYTGKIDLTTSTNNGDWAISVGNGSISDDVAANDGVASYTFGDDGAGPGSDDDGVVTLSFSNQNAETVNFNVIDEVIALGLPGVIVEEGTSDPSLTIGSCIPTAGTPQCAVGSSPVTVDIPISARNADLSLAGRMLLIATNHEGNGGVVSVSTSFDDVPPATLTPAINPQLLAAVQADETTRDNYSTLWAIDDATLPATAATYRVTVTHDDTDELSVCAILIEDVEQVYPTAASPAEAGPINTSFDLGDADNDTETTITTSENNAFVISIAGMGANDITWGGVSPDPPISRLINPPNGPDYSWAISAGTASTAAAITVNETPGATQFRHTHIVAAFNPLITGPPVAVGYVPVTLFRTYSGNISYRAFGDSLLTAQNGTNSCAFDGSGNAVASLTLPDVADGVRPYGDIAEDPFSVTGEFDSNILAAWLYWFGSGSYDLPNLDGTGGFVNTLNPDDFDNVTFSAPDGAGGFNVTNITADDVFVISNVGSDSNADFYAAYKDVTSLMVGTSNDGTGSDLSPNGDYTVSNLTWSEGVSPWLDRGSCAAGFAMVVVYENPYEQLRVVNLFHGFQPFQNSAFTLVPRNFRISNIVGDTQKPNGQVTHVTVEGDAGNTGPNEALTIQKTPGDFDPNTFNPLTTDFNPPGAEFNGTVTRPVYSLQDTLAPLNDGPASDFAYLFSNETDLADGNPLNGYEIDYPNPVLQPFDGSEPTTAEFGLTYGLDVDTHFIDGDQVNEILSEFVVPVQAEEITTRYAADQDLVLLVSEVISVTNDEIADIEVTVTEADPSYKVSSTGVYNFEVKNNGNGALIPDAATDIIELVGVLPSGLSFADGIQDPATNVAGTGWNCKQTANAFTCTNDITANIPAGLLLASLPTVSATVTFGGPPTFFPSLTNTAKVIARVQHHGDAPACYGTTTGVLPTPTQSCISEEFDNVNDLQGGALDINDLEDKTLSNNNVDSIETTINGTRTDLAVVKSVTTILEEGSNDSPLYTLTITNNGPDDILGTLNQPTFTITDDEPAGVNFDSATGSGAATDWSCNVNAGSPDQLVCEFDNSVSGIPFSNGQTRTITVIGDVTGNAGDIVGNTAAVNSGTYNFDQVPGNNSSFTSDTIQAQPAAATDRFLLSVSAAAAMNTTSLGSGAGELSNFSDDDIVLYNPLTDEAELFIDSATVTDYTVDDPNALHLLPNGNLVLSANTDGNSIGTGGAGSGTQSFDSEDLVIYNPLLNTAELFFDGSIIVDDPGDSIDVNIDALFVLNDGSDGNPIRFIFSTQGPALGPDVAWSDSDLVEYDGTNFSVYLDAEDDQVFGGSPDVQVDATYIRVDEDNSNSVIDTIVFSSGVQGATLGDNNVQVGLDDVAEIVIDSGSRPNPTTTTATSLFNGGVPIGVFDTGELDLKLNALHVIEPAYLGHFEITQDQAGNACTPARIRIRKHLTSGGNSHVADTNFTGSILIETDTTDGIWTVETGTPGNLDNTFGGSTDNGKAIYTFAAGDNGDVILSLNVVQDPPASDSVNVTVTNSTLGLIPVDENDGPFNFSLVTTTVTYQDNFDVAAFDNNNGTTDWANDWVEIDGFDGSNPSSGAGLATGNIQMTGGKLALSSNLNTDGGAINPSMTRAAALGFFDQSEDVSLDFDYGYVSATNTGDEIRVLVSSDGLSFTPVLTLNTLDGSSGSDIGVSINLSNDAPAVLAAIDNLNPNLFVRFEVTAGYVLGTFTVDNLVLTTGTTACNIGTFDHYDIIFNAGSNNGLACVASTVRIEAHDFQHNLTSPGAGTVVSLSVPTVNAGTWASVITGTGNLVDVGATVSNVDGMGTYTLTTDETFFELAFNYTDPAGDGASFNIDVNDGSKTEIRSVSPTFDTSHDPTITFAEAGILFYDETASSTDLPFQIAGKPSLTAPSSGNVTLQIVRSVPVGGENPAAACESLVDAGDSITLKLAGICKDPATCGVVDFMSVINASATTLTNMPVIDDANPVPAGTGLDVELTFQDYANPSFPGFPNIGAQVNFTYPDVGQISLYGEYEIPFNNDINGVNSGDIISGIGTPFIVRPFGFDIDFSGDRRGDTDITRAADATANPLARAGVGFDASVYAVAYDAADDVNQDGVPDFEADLSDNAITTNFGRESGLNHTVEVAVITDNPNVLGADDNPGVPGGVGGSLVLGDIFQAFNNGVSGPQPIAIDEVGIFDLQARLVENNVSRADINYFSTTPVDYSLAKGVRGGAANVGRIYPDYFELGTYSFTPRVNQSDPGAASSPFTYMGEEFGLNIQVRALNRQGNLTQNYIDGDNSDYAEDNFAKLADLSGLDIRAIIDEGDDVSDNGNDAADNDLGARLINSVSNGLPTDLRPLWIAGELNISGNMFIDKLGAPNPPLENVQIVIDPTDANSDVGVTGNDVVLKILDVDLDDPPPGGGVPEPGPFEFRLLATHEFRYGRFIVDNAYGPESEDLPISFRIEYYNSEGDFVVNTDDDVTELFFDVSSPAVSYVSDTYQPIDGSSFQSGDTLIEPGVSTDFTLRVNDGQSLGDLDAGDADRPFLTSAPGEEKAGRVIIEFDLDALNLDFLKYDWRGIAPDADEIAAEGNVSADYAEIPNGSYDDNPRATVEFGSYRGHDRVINWQEIYIGPSTP